MKRINKVLLLKLILINTHALHGCLFSVHASDSNTYQEQISGIYNRLDNLEKAQEASTNKHIVGFFNKDHIKDRVMISDKKKNDEREIQLQTDLKRKESELERLKDKRSKEQSSMSAKELNALDQEIKKVNVAYDTTSNSYYSEIKNNKREVDEKFNKKMSYAVQNFASKNPNYIAIQGVDYIYVTPKGKQSSLTYVNITDDLVKSFDIK